MLVTVQINNIQANNNMVKKKVQPADYLFWAVKQQTGSQLRNHILIILADHLGDKGCFPSYQTVADRVNCSRRSAINHIQKLDETGFLKRQKRANNGMSSSNKYHLNLDNSGVQEVHHPSAGDSLPSAGDSLGVVQELHPETPIVKHPIKHLVKHTPIVPSAFDAFYDAYPKKAGRQVAAKAWAKLNPLPALINRIMDDIIQRVEQGAWCTGSGKSFIPHASTYLNQHRWEDDIIPRPEFKPSQEQQTKKIQQMISEMDKEGSWIQ